MENVFIKMNSLKKLYDIISEKTQGNYTVHS